MLQSETESHIKQNERLTCDSKRSSVLVLILLKEKLIRLNLINNRNEIWR